MTARCLTRLPAAVLGCGLTITGCLLMTVSRPAAPLRVAAFALPDRLGPWTLLKCEQLPSDELKILHADDHWRRVYRQRDTGQYLVATLVVGDGGPLACHHPEICWSRAEFDSFTDSLPWTVPQQTDEFRIQTLLPRQIEQPARTFAYAWHDGDRWRSPEMPRLRLAGYPVLQQLQISMPHPAGMKQKARTALQQFIQLAVAEDVDGRG